MNYAGESNVGFSEITEFLLFLFRLYLREEFFYAGKNYNKTSIFGG